MEKRILGKDLEVSVMGLGCMGMTHGFGDVSNEDEMIEVIRGAVKMGLQCLILPNVTRTMTELFIMKL